MLAKGHSQPLILVGVLLLSFIEVYLCFEAFLREQKRHFKRRIKNNRILRSPTIEKDTTVRSCEYSLTYRCRGTSLYFSHIMIQWQYILVLIVILLYKERLVPFCVNTCHQIRLKFGFTR